MHQLCRICLEILTSPSHHLSNIQEGLKISTLAMIMLPIKITDDEDVSLPQKICSNCLEILLKSFKLRETSLESDRFLRTNPTTSVIDVKPEFIDESQPIVYDELYQDDNFPAQSFEISEVRSDFFREHVEFSDGLHIVLKKCQKEMSNKSQAWNYFGRLMDEENRPVGCSDSNYCSICLKNKKFVKYKKSTSSSTLASHMLKCHGINILQNRRNVDRSKAAQSQVGETPMEYISNIQKKLFLKEQKDIKKEANKKPRKFSVRYEDGASTVCNECGKNFKSWVVLKKHLVIHGEKNFKCSRCPRRFFYKVNLQKHEEIHDKGHLTRFICDLCGSRYSELQTVRNHIRKVHLNIQPERNFVCHHDDCHFAFFSRDRLKRHMLTHSKLKPHQCNYCDVAYASRGDLFKHLQKHHVGDALWNCEYCQASFRLKADLHAHYNVHYQDESNLESLT